MKSSIKFKAILLTGLFLLGICFGCSSAEIAEVNPFDEGLQLYYQKRFKESMGFFKEALEKDPLDTMAVSFYLSASYRSDQLIQTVNELEKQSLENEDNPAYRSYVGIGYFTRGLIDSSMMDEARSIFKEILAENPDLSIANTGMGMVYYQKRLIPRAKGYFIKAQRINPNDLMALEKLGEILMVDDKKPEEALKFFNRIIEMSPNYSDGYFYAASAYQRLGNIEEAVELFKKCMEIDPLGVLQGYNAPVRLGDIYLKQEEWEEAEKYYKLALAISPDNLYAQTQLEKAKTHGKQWKGEKVNPLEDKIDQ